VNSAASRNNDYLPGLPTNMPERDQIRFLHNIIGQLWQKQIEDKNNIEKLLSLVDANVSTKRILEIIGKIYGHTSTMADRKGENTDHDARYVTKREFLSYIGSVMEELDHYRFMSRIFMEM
jgi:hypothetical protein